jgi:hypothetical protein
LAGLTIGALLGLLFTEHPLGAIAGGAVGNALGNQPLSLEAAVRGYFTQESLPVIGFYRLGPTSVKVLFRYRDQFWTITSRAPDSPYWTPEDLDDWLYGDIINKKLPAKLKKINAHLNQ